MARSCVELLEPDRYLGSANLLLSEVCLAFRGDDDEPTHHACALLDLCETPIAAAALRIQEASILEGRTSLHALPPRQALDGARQLAQASGAAELNLVVAMAAPAVPELRGPEARLPGVWIGVVPAGAEVPQSLFDLVVRARRNPTLEAARVFRMLASLMAKDTVNCMDLQDFVGPLQAGSSCQLLDAFVLRGGDEVHLASTEDQVLLQRAAGVVIVQQLTPGTFGLRHAKRLVNSIRDRAPSDVPLTFHWPLAQRADLQFGPVQPVDILVALSDS